MKEAFSDAVLDFQRSGCMKPGLRPYALLVKGEEAREHCWTDFIRKHAIDPIVKERKEKGEALPRPEFEIGLYGHPLKTYYNFADLAVCERAYTALKEAGYAPQFYSEKIAEPRGSNFVHNSNRPDSLRH